MTGLAVKGLTVGSIIHTTLLLGAGYNADVAGVGAGGA